MKAPPLPPDEKERLQKLHSLGILYTPAEHRFDRITKIAKKIFSVPFALISLVDEDCQWFKSAQGLTVNETSREISFCGHAILGRQILVIPDTLENPDFSDNPLVTGDPFIRFYAGKPLQYEDYNIGTLCIIDTKPRNFTSSELDSLNSLANWIENELKSASIIYERIRTVHRKTDEQLMEMIDPLTGTWKKDCIKDILFKEIKSTKSNKKSFSLVLIDIRIIYESSNGLDEKNKNAEDLLIKDIAYILKSKLNMFDSIFRLNTCQFLIFLNNTNKESTQGICDQISTNINEENIELEGKDISLHYNMGALYIDQLDNISNDQLINQIEKQLEEAKSKGKNNIFFESVN